jgi:beta-aspartyl-peptidase (threonine type)
MMTSSVSPEIVTASAGEGPSRFAIVVHGGAGDVGEDRLKAHVEGCERAAGEGARVLAAGGSALDAVQRAVEALEADPLFNAGTGACLNREGHIELDASIMDGRDLRSGGVCALPPFLQPIAIARRVMEASPHVLLAAEGAARFAIGQGFARADEATMITEKARARWEAVRATQGTEGWAGGTVGAVARDANGHVAAATSTGGLVNKLVGRVGDSPIPGAGNYADDEAGACSTTGNGEAMMRLCAAKSAVDAMRLGATPEAAAREVIARMRAKTTKTGGLIVVGRDGSIGLARTTRTMTWALVNEGTRRSGA